MWNINTSTLIRFKLFCFLINARVWTRTNLEQMSAPRAKCVLSEGLTHGHQHQHTISALSPHFWDFIYTFLYTWLTQIFLHCLFQDFFLQHCSCGTASLAFQELKRHFRSDHHSLTASSSTLSDLSTIPEVTRIPLRTPVRGQCANTPGDELNLCAPTAVYFPLQFDDGMNYDKSVKVCHHTPWSAQKPVISIHTALISPGLFSSHLTFHQPGGRQNISLWGN